MTLQLFLDPSAVLAVSRSFSSFPTYLSTQPRVADPFLIVCLRTLPRGGDIEAIRLAGSRAILDTRAFRSCNDSVGTFRIDTATDLLLPATGINDLPRKRSVWNTRPRRGATSGFLGGCVSFFNCSHFQGEVNFRGALERR